MKRRLLALCAGLAVGPAVFAAVVSGTSALGVLDTTPPTFTSVDFPTLGHTPALLSASWVAADAHPGAVRAVWALDDSVDEIVLGTAFAFSDAVSWTEGETGLYTLRVAALDAYGNAATVLGPVVVLPPACVESTALDAELLDFGTVNLMGPVTRSFTIRNTSSGTCPTSLAGTISEECGTFSVSPASYELAQGESVTVTVTFEGDHSGQTQCSIVSSHGTVICQVNAMVDAGELATTFALSNPYPNPFNPSCTLRYSMDELGEASLKVYDLTGALQATLVTGLVEAGTHEVQVDGSQWSSGVYIAVLEAAGRQQAQKLILSK